MRIAVAPLFKQALRVDARSGRTYLVRGLMVLLLIVVLVPVQEASVSFGAPGLQLLSMIVGISAFVVCLGGPLYFASVITDEKESMTLGLLKMTGLSPLSVLMGKSTSQMLVAVMLLLAQLPLVVLAVALGGVSRLQIAAAYCALTAHLVLVANLALLASTICMRGTRAAVLTALFLLGFFAGPSFGTAVLRDMVASGSLQKGGTVDTVLGGLCLWAGKASVFSQLGVVLRTGFGAFPVGFQVLSNLGLGLAFFLLAWLVFEKATREEREAAPARGFAFRISSPLRLLGAGRAWSWALTWKDYCFMAGGKGMAVVKLVVLGLLLYGIVVAVRLSGDPVDVNGFGRIAMGVTLFLMALQLVLYHSRLFGNEKKWQMLSTLMILPMSTRGIAWRKTLAIPLALAPDLFWFGVGVACSPSDFTEAVGNISEAAAAWYFIAQFYLLLQLAVYFSLLLRRGGLLLAFVIWLFASYLAIPFVFILGFMQHEESIFALAAVTVLVLALWVKSRALKRLERAAGLE